MSYNRVRPGSICSPKLQLPENEISYQVWAAWAKAPRIWGLHVNEGILSKLLNQLESLRLFVGSRPTTQERCAPGFPLQCVGLALEKSFVLYNWKRSRKVFAPGRFILALSNTSKLRRCRLEVTDRLHNCVWIHHPSVWFQLSARWINSVTQVHMFRCDQAPGSHH